MSIALPPPIQTYFAGSNAHEPQAVAAAFAADGLVHDEKEVHRGRDAIAAWARSSFDKYQMRTEPLSSRQDEQAVVVKARVTGTFPGSPIELSFRFGLAHDGIASLQIG